MSDYLLTADQITAYGLYLHREEHTPGTVEKYLRDIRAFAAWLDGRPVTRELAAEWKEHLLATGHALGTVNSILATLNSFFRFPGLEYQVKFLKIQRRMFRDQSRELTEEEYQRLLSTARASGKERLALLIHWSTVYCPALATSRPTVSSMACFSFSLTSA